MTLLTAGELDLIAFKGPFQLKPRYVLPQALIDMLWVNRVEQVPLRTPGREELAHVIQGVGPKTHS